MTEAAVNVRERTDRQRTDGQCTDGPSIDGQGHWLGKLWASPVSLVGLLLGLLGVPFGSRLRFEQNALVFHRYPFGPGGTLVLGNVMLNTLPSLDVRVPTYAARARSPRGPLPPEDYVLLADHERAHTYQYETLGVLFLPLYLLGGGPTARNPFEHAADRYAQTGRGWWPYGRGEG